MKKALLSLTLAVALIAMIAAPAFAATYDLPVNGHSMQGLGPEWLTVGTDDRTDGIPVEIFEASTALVVYMDEPESLRMIAFGGGNNWDWGGGERDGLEQYWADGVLTIRWADINVNAATLNGADDNTGVKILLGDWGWDWPDVNATKAYLVYTAGGGGGGGSNNAGKTGDATMIALALIALTLAAGGAFLAARKIKA